MKKERAKTHIQKRKMIAALEKSLGVVTTASKIAEVDRRRHYEWMEKDKAYRKKVDDIQEMAIDFAESQLHKRIQEGNVPSVIFFLKCRGKKRGYVEKSEYDLNLAGGDGFSINVVLNDGDIA